MKLNRRKFFAFSVAAAGGATTQNLQAQSRTIVPNVSARPAVQPPNNQTTAPNNSSVADIRDFAAAVGTSSTGFADVAAAVRGIAAVAGDKPATLNVIADLAAGNAATVEIPANITVRIASAGRFVVPAGKTVKISGALEAGYAPIVAGGGQLDLTNAKMQVFRPEWFYSGSGSYHAAINECIRQASAAGGACVEFAFNTTYECSAPINAARTRGVRLKGFSPIFNSAPTIRYTGTASPALDARGSGSLTLDSINFQYTNANFTGIVCDLNWAPGVAADTHWFTAIDCAFTTGGAAQTAKNPPAHAFICASKAIITRVTRCHFYGAQRGIKGVEKPNYYSNVFNIDNCTFNRCYRSISSPGANYTITNCTFEPYEAGRACALDCEFPGYYVQSLVFSGNYVGDLFYMTEAPVTIRQGHGISILGNWFAFEESPKAPEAVRVENCWGITFAGNKGAGMRHGVRFTGSNHSVHGSGNLWTAREATYAGLETVVEANLLDFQFGDTNVDRLGNFVKGGTEHHQTFRQIGKMDVRGYFSVLDSTGKLMSEINDWGVTSKKNLAVFGNAVIAGKLDSGEIEITDATKGIIVRSPNGTRFRKTINDAGEWVTTRL